MEAPENIGSALKSIISRYGEMTSDPTKLVDSEGEEMSLNKVDKALKSVGITLQDANGQFKNFDEVILELSSKWDTIDTNTQRYIATVMAGNRQQSRFLAMVGNYERLAELSEEAADSEDAALIQSLKTMDSIDTKLNQMRVAFQEFYTSTGIESFIKWILNFVTNIINSLNSMPKLFGKIPIGAIALVTNLIAGLKKVATRFFDFAVEFGKKIQEETAKGLAKGIKQGQQESESNQNKEEKRNIFGKAEDWLANKIGKGEGGKKALIDKWSKSWQGSLGKLADFVGLASNAAATIAMDSNKALSGWLQIGGAAASAVGQFLAGNWVGAVTTAVTGIISGIDTLQESTEERIKRLDKEINDATNEALLSKNELRTLEDYRKKYEELYAARNDSNEAYQEWLDLNNEIASVYPSLISSLDAEGNYIVELSAAYEKLVKEKKANYLEDLKAQGIAKIRTAYDIQYQMPSQAEVRGNWHTVERQISDRFRALTDEDIKKWKTTWEDDLQKNEFSLFTEIFHRNHLGGGIEQYGNSWQSFLLNKFGLKPSDYNQGYYTSQPTEEAQLNVITSAESYFMNEKSLFYQDLAGSFRQAIIDTFPNVSLEQIDTSWLSEQGFSADFAALFNHPIEAKRLTDLEIQKYVSAALDFDSSLQESIVGTEMISKWQLFLDSKEADFSGRIKKEKASDIYAEYYSSFINNFENELQNLEVPEVSDEVEKLYLALDNYSLRLLNETKKELQIEEKSKIDNEISSRWKSEIFPSISRFVTGVGELFETNLSVDEFGNIFDENNNNVTDEYSAIASIVQNAPIEFLDEILSYYKDNKDSQIINKYASVWSDIGKLEADTAQQISTLVVKADLTTLTGILTLVDSVEQLDKTTADSIKDLISALDINLQTEWRLFSEKITTSLESLGEALNKASSGMNLKEAQEMASKLGVSITDFELVDGQFFYHNLEVLENAYLEQYSTLRQQLQSETQSQIDSLGEDFRIERSEADGINLEDLDLTEENKTLFNTYFEDWKDAVDTGEFTGTFYQYVVKQLSQMEKENLDITDKYLRQQVEQITRERLEQIYDTISNGISGSMSESEFSQLDYYLKENGYNFTLQTYKTAEGLKLTEDSVLRIYEVLKQTDSLAAQVVLDELTESAMEAEEKFNNIYEVLERITELNREIEEAKGTAREDALRRELVLAENIRDTLMEAGNAFNFMNQDLPTGHTNPLSAWEGMGDAWKVLEGDDFKAGYIDYTDLYNMINMMSSAGVTLQTEAGEFNFNAETASELIQAAGQALVNVDGETFVDLSKLGTQFQFGAEGMKEGLMKGIKIIAKSQIELLDAEIAMLETIIKTQQAFESIAGEDNQLNLSELVSDLLILENGEFYVNRNSTSYGLLLEHTGETLMEYNGELITIGKALDLLNDNSVLDGDKRKIMESLVAFLQNWYDFSDIGWTVEGGKLFKNGLEVKLPSVTFSVDSLGDESPLQAILKQYTNQEEISTFFESFKSSLGDKTTFTAQDLVQFATEQGFSDDFITWLIEQKDEIITALGGFSKEINGEKVTWSPEFAVYISDTGKFYNENNEEINPQEQLDKINEQLKSLGLSEITVESQYVTDINETYWTVNGEGRYDTEAEAVAAAQSMASSTISEKVKTEENVTTEIGTTADVIINASSISIGTKNEEGQTVLEDIGEIVANASSVRIVAEAGTVKFFDEQGNEITGPDFIANLEMINTDMTGINTLIDAVSQLQVPEGLAEKLADIAKALTELNNSTTTAGISRVGTLASNIKELPTGTKTLSVELKISSTGAININAVDGQTGEAKGTVANLSFATGNAKATGTLMGELGPELYVTGGRYYVAGQNGAEFVNLPSDAIVFNHLQTKRLLENGSVNETGKPITNERNATAMATGTTGPAKASASDALKELYEIRAMWQRLLDADASDFAKKAGSGGGSSGGGGEDDKAFMHELERWYNLLRQIAKLEQQITYEQAKRENMQSGYKHVQSLEKELALLKKQQAAHQELSDLQRKYYDERRAILEKTSYGELIFTYDEDGLMQYIEEDGKGLDILAELEKTDENGKAVRTAREQVAYLDSVGFDISTLLTNADGSKVKSNDYQTMMQIFWDGVDGWMAELDELYDSYNESMTSVEEAIQAQNEIMQEYIDNQLSVEERLMEAIVSREEAEIERLEKELDALEDATDAYLDGLKDSLDREKEMYEKNKDSEETSKLQRQLAILKRTGGSASEIQSLQDEISSRLEDSYFQQQEDQIDAIQQAADNQIEKLQTQIDIMNETLEYQKANGLLWEEVYEMMNNWSPEQMLQFIEENLASYRENSALQNDQDSQEALKEFEIWVAKRENAEALASAWKSYYDSVSQYSDEFKAQHAEGAKNAYSLAYATKGEEEAKKAADAYYAEMMKKETDSIPEDDKEPEDDNKEPSTTTPSTGSTKPSSGDNANSTNDKEFVKKVQRKLNNFGKYGLTVDGIAGTKTKAAIKDFQKKNGLSVDGLVGSKTWEKLKVYKAGGLVDFTGPAWVDGTKTKPEAFLSAEDTAMLKSKIFDNNKFSLRSVVELFEGISDSNRSITTNNDQGVVFENVQITIESGTISNDYDARRAGEMALEEMLKISRKTANRIVSRR